ncbi:hypothetical protein LUR56_03100 [Streptomyces sp. MT29]|nr:hypothetical protein [Streptomyces sp. MT29]
MSRRSHLPATPSVRRTATAAKPSGSPPTATRTDGPSAPATDRTHAVKTHADSTRTDTSRETARTTAASPSHRASTGTGTDANTAKDNGRPLFAPEQREKFDARIHQAVAGFVENPRQAVQEADAAFDEVVAELTQALAERSRLLRTDRDGERSEAGTEDLRIALQQYRDLTERLVRL